jgi:hypothetical protein
MVDPTRSWPVLICVCSGTLGVTAATSNVRVAGGCANAGAAAAAKTTTAAGRRRRQAV